MFRIVVLSFLIPSISAYLIAISLDCIRCFERDNKTIFAHIIQKPSFSHEFMCIDSVSELPQDVIILGQACNNTKDCLCITNKSRDKEIQPSDLCSKSVTHCFDNDQDLDSTKLTSTGTSGIVQFSVSSSTTQEADVRTKFFESAEHSLSQIVRVLIFIAVVISISWVVVTICTCFSVLGNLIR